MNEIHLSTQSILPNEHFAFSTLSSCKNKKSEDFSLLFSKATVLLDKIFSHPKVVYKIQILHDKICNIEKAIQNSKEKIEQLEGGKITKIPLLGTLIKIFFMWHNSKTLHREYDKTKNLQQKRRRYKKKIEILQNFLHSLKNLKKEVNEHADEIFQIESELRETLEKDFPEKEKYQKLYDEKIFPLVQRAKESIVQRAFHFTSQAAASKGKAAHRGLQALKNLAENQPVLKNRAISTQQIFLLPKEGVVFKDSDKCSEEEERLANNLFDLMSKQAVVGTFNIRKTSVEKLGISISQEAQIRGFKPKEISPNLCAGIKQKLSHNDFLLLQEHEANSLPKDKELTNYQQIEEQEWHIRLIGEEPQIISFKELQRLNLSEKLSSSTLIGSSSQKMMSLQDHILEETPFFRALNYLPNLHCSSQNFYLSPNLNDPEDKKAYELCEQFKWSYTDKKGKKECVNFKTLHALFLQNESLFDIEPVLTSSFLDLPTKKDQFRALNVEWKAITPEAIKFVSSKETISSLRNIQAKPFIPNMILMKDLSSSLKNVIFQRLTHHAEFNSILTGEVQLLDLHHENLGLVPEPNPEYEHFKNFQFSISSSGWDPENFKTILFNYLSGKIQFDTVIQFKEKGLLIQKPLKDLPALQTALNVRWQFVIFDTDLSLSEDNRLQLQTSSGVEQHLIPFRSVLLETNWKDQPLSKETVQRLMNSFERDQRVENWIKKKDAPIYKQLSKTAKANLEKLVAPFIKKYDLSEFRKNYEDVTVKNLQEKFIKEISDLNQPEQLKIWKTLEQDLSFVSIRANDTYETIAQRYHQNLEELHNLNPGGLIIGQKFKIKYDLTSFSPEAMKKRESIAAQLFPRLTHRQQEALLERQHQRKEYLIGLQALANSTLKREALLIQMEQFLKKASTPMTSVRKKRFLKDLQDQKKSLFSHNENLLSLKNVILEECKPSYFNLMKAMYPLLADAYALNQAVYGDEYAGICIGLYAEPLEETIKKAKLKFNSRSDTMRLVENLEYQIAHIQNPAFFGHWE